MHRSQPSSLFAGILFAAAAFLLQPASLSAGQDFPTGGSIFWSDTEQAQASARALSRQLDALGQLPQLPRLTPVQRQAVLDLDHFRVIYDQWQGGTESMEYAWLDLADRVLAKYTIPLLNEHGDPYIVRCVLAKAECRFFASLELMRQSEKQQAAVEQYQRGIRLMDQVLRSTHEHPEFATLPDFSSYLLKDANGGLITHPLAGYEYIATQMNCGLRYGGSIDRDGAQHISIPSFQRRLVRNTLPRRTHEGRLVAWPAQESSQLVARRFLAEYCPWGAELYFLLDAAGMTSGLDYRILRPFGGDNGPMIDEVTISGKQVPMFASDELQTLIWAESVSDDTAAAPGGGELGRKIGFLTPTGEKRIVWEVVQPTPDYLVRFVSPRMVKATPGEQFERFMSIKKLFGKPLDVLSGMWGDLVSSAMDELLSEVLHYYGGQSMAYQASWIFVSGAQHGFITSDHLVDGKMPTGWVPGIKSLGAALFAELDRQLFEGFYEGVDPRKFSMGTGYLGEPIPPIFMRGDVLGFQRVSQQEYCRTVQAVRMYELFPSALVRDISSGGYRPYDLRGDPECWTLHQMGPYLAEQSQFLAADGTSQVSRRDVSALEHARTWAWREFNTPIQGFRTVVTDFSPWQQVLTLTLPEADYERWKQSLRPGQNLWCELSTEREGARRPMLEEVVLERAVTLRIFNTQHSRGKSEFIGRRSFFLSHTRGRATRIPGDHPMSFRYFAASDDRLFPVAALAFETQDRLQTRYRVVIKDGPGAARVFAQYAIAFAPGRGKQAERTQVTGSLSALKVGVAHLKYFPSSSDDELIATETSEPPRMTDSPPTATNQPRLKGIVSGGLDPVKVKAITDYWANQGWSAKFTAPTVTFNVETGDITPKQIVFVAEFSYQNITETTTITHDVSGPTDSSGDGIESPMTWSGSRRWRVDKVDEPGARRFRDVGVAEWTATQIKEGELPFRLSVANAFAPIFGDIEFLLDGQTTGNGTGMPGPPGEPQDQRETTPLFGTYEWKDSAGSTAEATIKIHSGGATLHIRNHGGVAGANGRVDLKLSPEHSFLGRFPAEQDVMSGNGPGIGTGQIASFMDGKPFTTSYWRCDIKGNDWPEHYGKIQLFWAGPDGNTYTYYFDAGLTDRPR